MKLWEEGGREGRRFIRPNLDIGYWYLWLAHFLPFWLAAFTLSLSPPPPHFHNTLISFFRMLKNGWISSVVMLSPVLLIYVYITYFCVDDPYIMDYLTIKASNPQCRRFWCLIEFIDWRYNQSCWNIWPALWTIAPLTFSLVPRWAQFYVSWRFRRIRQVSFILFSICA